MAKDGKPMVKEKEGLVSRIDRSRRYSRNMTTISQQEQELLKEKSVCIVGCGGLGGGVIEALARMGVGHMTLVDGDCFDVTNLNRQVFSNEKNIGCPKAREAARQIGEINSEIDVKACDVMLDGDNAVRLVKEHDVVVDALDNISARRILEEACEEEGIPLVHGAIAGWTGQVAVITPGCRLMGNIYGGFESVEAGEEQETGNPSFTPAVVSGIQAAETVKLLLGREGTLTGRMLMLDLLEHQYEIIEL